MEKTILISAILVALSFPVNAKSTNVVSFTTAKNKLYSKVFNNSGETLYCGCNWSARKTDLSSCDLQSFFPKKQRKRALRTEAEHIIPASWMYKVNNKQRQCVTDAKAAKESGRSKLNPRKYCQKHDQDYKKAHNDLVNLYPAVGQINADRSNKPYVDVVKNKVKSYGKCDIKIGSRGIVPPSDKKGDIARVAFYMNETYGITYSKRQLQLFKQWDNQDPISAEEKAHNKRVIKVQGFGLQQQ
jgi:deoxyribonuclease-1